MTVPAIDDVWVVYKPLLWTPLQALERLRNLYPQLVRVKLTYVGRLDPLAEGVMLVLPSTLLDQKQAFTLLPKTYEFDLVLGLSTDSYDLMGLPRLGKQVRNRVLTTTRLARLVSELVGPFKHPYPPYSGKTVGGVKLFELAKNGQLTGKQLPLQKGEVFTADIIGVGELTFRELFAMAALRVQQVTGDFRQKEIVTAWGDLPLSASRVFPVYKIRVSCSSGLFVRSMAHVLGEQLSMGGLTTHIIRTRVGGYSLEDCLYLNDN